MLIRLSCVCGGRVLDIMCSRGNRISFHEQFIPGAERGSLGTWWKDKEMIVGWPSDVSLCVYLAFFLPCVCVWSRDPSSSCWCRSWNILISGASGPSLRPSHVFLQCHSFATRAGKKTKITIQQRLVDSRRGEGALIIEKTLWKCPLGCPLLDNTWKSAICTSYTASPLLNDCPATTLFMF